MTRWPVVRAVALPLLIVACGHHGYRATGDPAVDPAAAAMVAGGGTFCVVRPPVPAAAPPRYALATVPDSALLHARSGQLVLQVQRDDGDDGRAPRPQAIALLQTMPPPVAAPDASPEELGQPMDRPAPKAVPVAAGQTDTKGQLALRPVAAGRYLGEVYAAARQPWTGAVDVRMGYADTIRIVLRPRPSRTPVTLARCE
jgi:hypothetical protein